MSAPWPSASKHFPGNRLDPVRASIRTPIRSPIAPPRDSLDEVPAVWVRVDHEVVAVGVCPSELVLADQSLVFPLGPPEAAPFDLRAVRDERAQAPGGETGHKDLPALHLLEDEVDELDGCP